MRNLSQTLLTLFLASFAPCYGAETATYVVAVNNQTSSDHGPGTAARPFRTITRAMTLAGPGDVVKVMAGIYREDIRLARGGTPNLPIRLVADPPGAAIVTGSDPLLGFVRVEGPEPIYRLPWPHRFIIDHDAAGIGIEHHPPEEPLWGRAEQIAANDNLLLPVSSLDQLRRDWVERERSLSPPVQGLGGPFGGKFWTDTSSSWLYLWLSDGSDPVSKRLEGATRERVIHVASPAVGHIHVKGFVFRDAASFPQRPAVDLRGVGIRLEGCVVERMAGAGVAVHGTMRSCLVRGNGHVGGAAIGTNFLNEDTIWQENSWKPISRGWEAGGAKLTLSGPGIFRRCHFVRNGGPGLWFDIDAHDISVDQCLFSENEKSGLFIEISRNISATNNVVNNNAVGIIGKVTAEDWGVGGIELSESTDCTIRGNIVQGNKDGITLREQGPRTVKSKDGTVRAYHNRGHLIVENTVEFNHGYQLAFWADNSYFGWHPAEQDQFATLANWRLHGEKTGRLDFDPRAQGFTIARNRYLASPGRTAFLYGAPWRPLSATFDTLSAFTAATGFDAGSQLLRQPAPTE